MYMSQIIDRKYITKKAIRVIHFIQFTKSDLDSKKNPFCLSTVFVTEYQKNNNFVDMSSHNRYWGHVRD